MPKRKQLAEREREQILEAVALEEAPVNTLRKIWNLALGRKTEAHRNAFYECAPEVLKPHQDCYTALRVEEGIIVLANLDKLARSGNQLCLGRSPGGGRRPTPGVVFDPLLGWPFGHFLFFAFLG